MALRKYSCEFHVRGTQLMFTRANSLEEAIKNFEEGEYEEDTVESPPDLDQSDMIEDTVMEHNESNY